MKSSEEFKASVYARAATKRAALDARNKKIRTAAVSLVCVLVVAAAALPLSRMHSQPPLNPQAHYTEESVTRKPNNIGEPQMVLLIDTSGNSSVVVLRDKELQKAFVSQYKEENNLSNTRGVPLISSYDTAKTIHSTGELAQFLTALPQDSESLQEAMGDYDDEFFSTNDLCAVPMEISPGEPLTEAPDEETTVPADTTLPDEITTVPDATQPSLELTENCTDADTTSAAEPPTGKLPHITKDAYLLLLVPTNK